MNKDLFDLLKTLEDRSEQLQEVFGTSDYFDSLIDIVWYLILEKYGISQHNDDALEILSQFGCGEIKKRYAIGALEKLKTI